jgi:SagB-type dehydrogenase family enzyme
MGTLKTEGKMKLPEPKRKGKLSLEETIVTRRSIREFSDRPLTLQELSQILWSAQGVTSRWGGRAAPSAGALFPIDTFVAVGNVESLEAGVYRYNVKEHALEKTFSGDVRKELAEASLKQDFISVAPVSVVLAAVYERITVKYGRRGHRYTDIEIGHIGQNIYLQAEALNLATVAVGAFHDDEVKRAIRISAAEPIYIMPIGHQA